ncbi:type III secretion system cytoplasmic ring protein SctQ [Pseudomonas viridiflava]|uniref:type III secretion system cytoplasmic ring protein SctQ n=2 Tax=Pseudomonas viridiflava TaxID=33069 RepID=UPI000F020BF2|nr:type III secretion system cytoplasmic ring protein SctQ [Pseudomonas viridiflava]
MTAYETSFNGAALSDLPSFDPDVLSLHNRLHRRVADWHGVLRGQPMRVQWACGRDVDQPCVSVALMIGQTLVELRVPEPLFERSWMTWQPGSAIDRQNEALLLEQAWLGWIEPLEAILGEPLQVVPWAADPTARCLGVTLEVHIADFPAARVELRMNSVAADHVAALLERYAMSDQGALQALRLVMSAEAGHAPLRVDELRSLAPGDVVMLDTLPDDQVRLRIGQHLQAHARRSGRSLEWCGPWSGSDPDPSTATHFNRNDAMNEPTVMPDLDVSLDALPLTLVCQLGSVELTLEQLRAMAPGTLLPLASSGQDEVDLMVNGRRIGRGELVRIGDGLGVRLLGFNAP